jgi:hypothetical protein
MSTGRPAECIELGPPVLLAHDGDRRTFNDTSGGRQPRAAAWWHFWA